MIQTFKVADFEGMEKLARVQLATSLPGVKPIALIGTKDRAGRSNLAPFSSIIHLGSIPALLGMVSRPDTVDRHTLSNLVETGEWTINHLHPEILAAAHQCSARYPRDISEFTATGLTEHYESEFSAPFVAESRFRIGMKLEEIIPIPSNGTQLIVGRVTMVQVVESALLEHGGVDLVGLDCLASTALDTYFRVLPLGRLPHATLDL
jgi:flavin reductase (DIM6/NTAB) family NADH-FMN oxidoreductase RutF